MPLYLFLFASWLMSATARGYGSSKGKDFYPLSYAIGSRYVLNSTQKWTRDAVITLSLSSPIVTLDYDNELAGFPFLEVLSASGKVQLELKYGESFVSLEAPSADGPWTFVNGLSNSFRTETFAVTKRGRIESFFIQGGQRWQSVQLLTKGIVTFRAGMRLSTDHIPAERLPGSFSASNSDLEQVFDLGGRAVQVSCIDAESAPSTWQVTLEGTLVRGQATSQSAKGINFANYTLSFSTKIVRGGTGFRIGSGALPYGSLFVLVSNQTDLVNTNHTLLPANSLIYNYGWSIINQSTLAIPDNQVFPINFTIEEGRWYDVSASIEPAGYRVKVNDQVVAFVSNAVAIANPNPIFGSGSPYQGTWGFGPSLEQDAYFKDVVVTAANGSVLDQNTLTSQDVLAEYSVTENKNSVCMDGGKRDRLVWIGDFYHTAQVILSTTFRTDYFEGTIKQAFDFVSSQPNTAGFAAMSSQLGSDPRYKDAIGGSQYLLTDYQDLFLISIAEYYQKTGDLKLIQRFWPNIRAAMDRRLTFNDPIDGLSTNGGYFLGPDKGSAPTALNVFALQHLVPLATAVNDPTSADRYTTAATRGTAAVQTLWNSTLGSFSLSPTSPSDFSLATIAFTILANISTPTQTTSMLSLLPQLRVGIGYKDSTLVNSTSTTQLSPNIAGFLLSALFTANRNFNTTLAPASVLLQDFWPAMFRDEKYRSGASWEYLYPDGRPGIDLFTSLSHPWGAAPSYVLPRWVLGVRETRPGFGEWEVRPGMEGLGLSWAKGRVPTPKGVIVVGWWKEGKGVRVEVEAPAGTRGVVVVGRKRVEVDGGRKVAVRA
ncbi:Methylenetetrahydrofolate reductase 1 [Elsinoe australis]|uniref:Methylenetetrahydrofolate reductase 1 n=1 Tax=Elsinoe australis TaxID=40998 RepID=A0A2P7Z1P6_9PEZI|nr:Methylenetetrahydrofolate reductase 1 [Elsinoe australis]